MPLHLDDLNHRPVAQVLEQLQGVYEHSPWVVQSALQQRPFATLESFKQACIAVVQQAGTSQQIALLCAHPELGGPPTKTAVLTAESRHEQQSAGLPQSHHHEQDRLLALNRQYRDTFGWPFILAVRGPRGTGMQRHDILDTLERRLTQAPDTERAECLRQVHRIAELRLHDLFNHTPRWGQPIWDWHAQLALHSETQWTEQEGLTVTYLSQAHRACAEALQTRMRACGLDEVHQDAVGNVVGRYHSAQGGGPYLLTGSHYDTVRHGGRYDGRLGILTPLAVLQHLHASRERLPFGVEVVAFAEEEGVRFGSTFLGSSALSGDFQPNWLTLTDAQGTTLAQALQTAGLDATGIAALRRPVQDYLAFVEIHIEQGPVLWEQQVPLGVVTAINGQVRLQGEVSGQACHAGATPMGQRRDAACAVAEWLLAVERRATETPGTVATVGQLDVPEGGINVVPGCCRFSLDVRATTDTQRDHLLHDLLTQLQTIAARRGVRAQWHTVHQASAAPCHADWQHRWAQAVTALGLPVVHLPSGAGHDAMQIHRVLPQAMLFVRGQHQGISHHPLESVTCEDMDLAAQAFHHLLRQLTTAFAAPPP